MSNIDNLGRYADFSKDADKFIQQIKDNAKDDAALQQPAEGAILLLAAAGAVAVGKYVVDRSKSKSRKRKVSTATATEKLKIIFKKMQNSDDAPDEAGGQKRDGGDEN